MTGLIEQLTIPGMAKPGKRKGTPAEVRAGIIARTKAAREASNLDKAEVAARLSERTGRNISYDTYRKWEEHTLMPHDMFVPFCYVTGTDLYELLSGEPFRLGRVIPFPVQKRHNA